MLSTLERQPQASVTEHMSPSSPLASTGKICEVISILGGCMPTGDTPEDRELREALKKASALLQARQVKMLRAQAGYVREVSEAAIFIGWITHDVGEVANNSNAIKESVTELAAAAGHITEASQFCSVEIASVRNAMQKSTNDMLSTGESMHAAATRVGTILEQVSELENAVKQIAEMAKIGGVALINLHPLISFDKKVFWQALLGLMQYYKNTATISTPHNLLKQR